MTQDESALDQAARRLDRALSLLEQELAGRRAGGEGELFDPARSNLAAELERSRERERRLEAAGAVGIPQVVSLGALDMVNFGPEDTVPARFAGRTLYRHNAAVTLMRTTPEECAELGRTVARKLNAASGPVTLFVPWRGVSAIAVEGGVFHDPDADRALIRSIRDDIGSHVDVREMDTDINDPAFARAMADALHEAIVARAGREREA